MRRHASISILTVTIALAGLAAPSYAQQPSEARIRELIRVAAERVAAGQATQPAAPAQSQAPDTRPVVRLTLEDAVKAALDNNLDIVVQRLNPQVQDIAYSSARSVYYPTVTATVQTQNQTNPSNSSIAGGAQGSSVFTKSSNLNGGVSQSVPLYGGTFQLTFNNTKQLSSNTLGFYTTQLQPLWTGQYTQPLMRNFRIDATRQTLAVTAVARDITDVQLKATMTNTLSNVRNAYWDYVNAIQSVDVAKQSLALSDKLVQDNQTRVQVGTMAPIDVVSAQSQAATARQNLVVAQASVRTTEIALKRLLVSGTQDPLWSSAIDPVDRPDFQPQAVDVEAAIRRALSERTDVAIAKKNLEGNDITLSYLRDQTLPQMDLVALYGAQGLGGIPKPVKDPLNPGAFITPPGSYSDAFSSLSSNPRWTVALNLSYPLGLSAQRAAIARANVQQNQINAQLKQLELQVATDVTNAAINVQSNAERVQAAQAARELSERSLNAENSKFEVGMSTNYLVVQAQRDLATAQNNELVSILNYRKSLVELDRLQQTTLGNLGITVIASK